MAGTAVSGRPRYSQTAAITAAYHSKRIANVSGDGAGIFRLSPDPQ